MLAGDRAYEDYAKRADSVSQISALLSAKPDEVAPAVERLLVERDALQYKLGGLKRRIIQQKVGIMQETQGNLVFFEPDFDMKDLQLLATAARDKCAVAAAFSGDDEAGWKYVLASQTVDLREKAKAMNAALNGRGGGKPELVTGSVKADRETIERYWHDGNH